MPSTLLGITSKAKEAASQDGRSMLAKFPFPTLDAAFFASLMRGAMAVLILAALVWLASGFVRRFMQGKDGFADKALAKAPARERR